MKEGITHTTAAITKTPATDMNRLRFRHHLAFCQRVTSTELNKSTVASSSGMCSSSVFCLHCGRAGRGRNAAVIHAKYCQHSERVDDFESGTYLKGTRIQRRTGVSDGSVYSSYRRPHRRRASSSSVTLRSYACLRSSVVIAASD